MPPLQLGRDNQYKLVFLCVWMLDVSDTHNGLDHWSRGAQRPPNFGK